MDKNEELMEKLDNDLKKYQTNMDPYDVAEFLGISKTSAYKLFSIKGFPRLKIPGTKRLKVPKYMFRNWYAKQLAITEQQ